MSCNGSLWSLGELYFARGFAEKDSYSFAYENRDFCSRHPEAVQPPRYVRKLNKVELVFDSPLSLGRTDVMKRRFKSR